MRENNRDPVAGKKKESTGENEGKGKTEQSG